MPDSVPTVRVQNSEAPGSQKQALHDEPAWKRTVRAHRGQIGRMAVHGVYRDEQREQLEKLAEKIDFALSPLGTVGDTEGAALASGILEWIDAAKEG